MIAIQRMIFLVMLLSIGNCLAQTVTVPPPVDYSQPITLIFANDSPYDLQLAKVITRNVSPEDLARLQDSSLYSHTEHSFTFRRTGYPVYIFLIFKVASTESAFPGYSIAKWEYTENDNQAQVCHIAEAVKPYTIGCSGDDQIKAPHIDLSIGYVEPVEYVPQYPLPSP